MSSAASGAAQLVERLIADHRRIEEVAATVLEDCVRGDRVVALATLGELHTLMERHDGLEEHALFPLLGRKQPDLAERIAHVRSQHRAADGVRGTLERALLAADGHVRAHGAGDRRGDGAVRSWAQRADELYALLVGNHTTEELVIYAAIDELLADLHREESA